MSSKKNTAQAETVTRTFTAKEIAIVDRILEKELAVERTNEAKAIVQVLFKAVTGGDFTLADLQACFEGCSKDVLNTKLPAMKTSELADKAPRSTPENTDSILSKMKELVGDLTIEEVATKLAKDLPTARYWMKKALAAGVFSQVGKRGHSLVYGRKNEQPAQAPATVSATV